MYRLSNYGYKYVFNIQSNEKLLMSFKRIQSIIHLNHYSSKKHHQNAKEIRKEFIEYFKNDLDHTFIPPSPIIPWCDPSVSFINSGMNQFKGIFLGEHEPPTLKAVNFQKCIRVGGKHNDLTDVGIDSYHHTFFEMLGNWSFGAYGKEEACKYAWDVLTRLFGINKAHLYVTYFGGDESLGLKADLECRDIWLKLGVSMDRIFSSGIKDNFWEMNLNGPCGPCTEIHIDKSLRSIEDGSVKQINPKNLTELWNIVFIEHQRLKDGSIVPLNKQYIDTGMGFERLVAVLQGKKSNYDTDIFQPLFKAIHEKSNAPIYSGKFGTEDVKKIDTGYRILADHARMITIALADGMVPEKNHKLRRILRRAIIVGEETFQDKKLLNTLIYHVAESLGDTYPEINGNFQRIQTIIEYEANLLEILRASSEKEWRSLVQIKPALATISDPYAPGLIRAYEELQIILKNNPNLLVMPSEMVFKMYDTYGLDVETIEELAETEKLSVDRDDFKKSLEKAKMRSRIGIEKSNRMTVSRECINQLKKTNVPKTDDSYKYKYSFDKHKYQFPPLECKIVGLTMNGEFISEPSMKLNNNIFQSSEIGVLLDKTLFYSPEGGQISDRGSILIKNVSFNISEVQKLNGYIFHQIAINKSKNTDVNIELFIGNNVIATVNENYRTDLMRNHTATHLLNAALRNIFPAVIQRGSVVKNTELIFKFNNFGAKILSEHIHNVNKLVNDCINANVPVKTKTVDMFQFLTEKDLTLVPGENYPDKGLRIVEIDGVNLKSKEACCGTHVHNTSVLNKFSIVNFSSKGSSSHTIKAVTGSHVNSSQATQMLNSSLNYLAVAKTENDKKEIVMSFISSEMTKALKSRMDPFIVHCLDSNDVQVESIPLQKAFEFCTDLPVFLICKSRRKIKMRCVVPEEYQSANFNAQLWLEAIQKQLPIKIGSFEDEDPLLTCHTKVLKVSRDEITLLTENALKEAKSFVLKHVRNDKKQLDHVSN